MMQSVQVDLDDATVERIEAYGKKHMAHVRTRAPVIRHLIELGLDAGTKIAGVTRGDITAGPVTKRSSDT